MDQPFIQTKQLVFTRRGSLVFDARRGRRLSRRKAASYQRRALLRPVIQCLLPGAALALDWGPIRWSRCDTDHCWPFLHPRPIFHPPRSSLLRRAGRWPLTAQTCAKGPGGQHAGARAPTRRHLAQALRLGTAARPAARERAPHAPLHRRPAAHGANACAVSLPLIPRHRCLWPTCEALPAWALHISTAARPAVHLWPDTHLPIAP